MKEYLRQLIEQAGNDLSRGSLIREYLQSRVLESLQDTGAFLRRAFLGGTALRFLFSIPRFSEDLDFSLIHVGQETRFRTALVEVKRMLTHEGYQIEVNVKDWKTVALGWIRFPGLLYELGLSPRPSQVLSIKLDVRTGVGPRYRAVIHIHTSKSHLKNVAILPFLGQKERYRGWGSGKGKATLHS